jgi:hypothetical protein
MATDAPAPNPLVLTISALVIVVACILLGRWQLDRVYRPIDGYSAEPAAVPLQTLVPAGAGVPPAAVGRQVTLSGRYAGTEQDIVPGHFLSGQPVSWVVTPLVLSDHTQVLVVRGWIGPGGQALATVTSAAVSVTGRIETGAVLPGGSGAPAGGLTPLRSGYLIRTAQSPPDPLSLQPAPAAPPHSDAPAEFHLQNAIYVTQWMLLAGIIVVGWWRLRGAGQKPHVADDTRPMEPVA